MREAVGRAVDIGGTCVRVKDDLTEAGDSSFQALNQPEVGCTESNCRTGYHSGSLTIGRMKDVVGTPWYCVVVVEAGSLEGNSDNVPVPLGAVPTAHTTMNSAARGDIHPDMGCCFASRVTEVNGESRRRCCRRS